MRRKDSFYYLLAVLMCGCGGGTQSFCPDNSEKELPGVCGCAIADIDTDHDNYMDCVDFCPQDPEKHEPGSCGCGTPDTDSDQNGVADCLEILYDFCLSDPNKTEPGICGCGIPDSDDNRNGVIDCLEEKADHCPEDPNKTLPGICGCNVPEMDTDKDGYADCIDACPEDPTKVLPGGCGCGVSEELLGTDTDHDGVSDCLDACPQNPDKWEAKWEGNCDGSIERDLDEDGVPDTVDPCPFNANVKDGGAGLTPLEIADYCTEGQFSAGKLTISSALDFLQLRQILAASEGTLGHACDSATWIPQCTADGAALTVCQDGLLIQRSCSCLESDDGVATCDESTLDIERNNLGTPLEIIVDGTINLGDVLDTTVTGDVCEGPYLSGVRLDNVQLHGEHHASIIFQKDGMRCALKDALFTGIALSEVSGLTLDYDVFGHVRGALANDVRGSDISDVVFMGNMYSLSSGNVGGVIGDASPISNTDIERPVSLRDVVSSGAIIEAGRAQSVGGAIGKITKGEYTQINLQNEIQSLRGQGNVGGLVGFLADGNIHHVNNRVKTLICDNSSAQCGGFAGQIELGERGTLTDIRNEVTEITGTSNIYVGGFAGQLSYTSANAHLGKVANILTIGHSLQGNPVSGVYASLSAPSNGSMNMSNIVSAARLFNTNHTEIYVPMFVSSVGSSFSVSDYYWYGGTNAKATTSSAYTTGQITSDTTSEALSEIVTTLNNNTTNLELQGVWSVEKIALGPAGSPISVTLPQLKIQ